MRMRTDLLASCSFVILYFTLGLEYLKDFSNLFYWSTLTKIKTAPDNPSGNCSLIRAIPDK